MINRFTKACSAARPVCVVCCITVLHSFLTAAEPQFSKLIVSPTTVELNGAEDAHGLLVTALTADGESVDVTAQAQFKSMLPAIATVSERGLCQPRGDGRTEVMVMVSGKTARVQVAVTNSGVKTTRSFRQDVLPVLTKTGCNSGACHGKLAGQNTFKLSLRAFAPEWDIDWLTKEVHSRRINYAFPDESLVIQKALARVPHEGGLRFPEGSRYHRTLTDWISARAPGPQTNESDVTRIEVMPGQRTMKPGQTQQLLVRAFYENGRIRDVTWLAQFFSNDETTLTVTPEGVVRALRPGESTVRAHFQGQVEVLTFTMPYTNHVSAREFAARNNVIDDHVMAKLHALRIPPAALCDDHTFIRRAFLDTVGTLPTPEEVRNFAGDSRPDKRARLVDDLLARPEWVDYWTLQFADLLQNRKERDHDVRGTKGVRSFHTWLREQLASNRPWNELARELLLASGDSSAHPEVGYYITLIGEKKPEDSEITDAVAQAFLGNRIGCAKCHNHPLEKFTQDDYYHFAAFFSRVSLKRVDPMNGATALVAETKEELEQRKRIAEIEKALGELENGLKSAPADQQAATARKVEEQKKKLDEATKRLNQLRTEKKAGALQPRTKKMMAPQPLDRTPLATAPGQDPRPQLVSWIVDPENRHFSGAMVNRLWKHFFSVGLVEPVDDLRASNPPSHPSLWDALSGQLVAQGFDVKHLMRLILNSRTYQLSADTQPGNQTDRKFFSHYYARRLPAEVMLDAVGSATDVPGEFKGYPVGTRAIQLPEPGVSSYFLTLFGRSDRVTACACERNGEVTLPQLLHLQNSEDISKKLVDSQGRLAWLLPQKEDARIIDELFLASVARPPRPEEVAAIQRSLNDGDAREEVFRDLFWALLNSKEFAFNH